MAESWQAMPYEQHLELLDALERDGVGGSLTLSVSPPLASMLADPTLDLAVADLDGDHLPDVAVGRIPAAEARAIRRRADELRESFGIGAVSGST